MSRFPATAGLMPRQDGRPPLATRSTCKRPTTEQILRLFSLAERHTLIRHDRIAQVFPAELTDLQCQVLALLGVPEHAFRS